MKNELANESEEIISAPNRILQLITISRGKYALSSVTKINKPNKHQTNNASKSHIFSRTTVDIAKEIRISIFWQTKKLFRRSPIFDGRNEFKVAEAKIIFTASCIDGLT